MRYFDIDEQLQKRIKSFAWRAGMMTVVYVITLVLDSAVELELPPYAVVGLGLLVGELSKFLNCRNR